jgi:large subunit ribosomal protein L2
MKLTRFRPVPALRTGRFSKTHAGRNNQGRITVRHHGGGHKRFHRKVRWGTNVKSGQILGFSYDPRRTARLASVLTTNNSGNSERSFILAAKGISVFSSVTAHNTVKNNVISSAENNGIRLRPGDTAPLSSFEAGDFLHAVQAYEGQRPLFARAAGTFCQVRSIGTHQSESWSSTSQSTSEAQKKEEVSIGRGVVRLPSGSQRLISTNVRASYGIVSSEGCRIARSGGSLATSDGSPSRPLPGKAGRTRWLGRRPTVRGTARNPVDHPHGGNSRGRPSVSFRGRLTKGGHSTRSPRRPSSSRILTPRVREGRILGGRGFFVVNSYVYIITTSIIV